MKKVLYFKIVFFFFISFFITLYFIGPKNIFFDQIEWLYSSGDISNAQLSWQYFKDDEWRFPLGKNPNYGMEISNSIVFTDNIPLFAILFKLFKNVLSEKSQYFGIWVLLCFFLQLIASNLLLIKISKNEIFSFLGSLIFLLCPFLLFRLSHHLSLGAHWLILYAFYISYFIKDNIRSLHWIFLITLSVLIHFYFTAMIFIIFSSFLLEKILKEKKIIKLKFLFFYIFYTLIIMYIVGYFETSVVNNLAIGYGVLNIDLLSFLDSKVSGHPGWSLFFLNDIIKNKTIEGFIYIGLGNILLFLISIIFFIKKINFKNLNFYNNNVLRVSNIYIIIFLLWALTTNLSILDYEIFNISLPKFVYGVLSIFEATGRFAWPVIYILIIFSMSLLYKNLKNNNAIIVIFILLVIQFIDVSIGIKNNSFVKQKILSTNNHDQIWNFIDREYKNIRTTYLFNNYGEIFSKMKYPLSKLKNINTDITLNAAHDRKIAANVRYKLIEDIENNYLNTDTAYIVDNPGHLRQLKKKFGDLNYGFFYRDDVWIILPQQQSEMKEEDLKNFKNIKLDDLNINEEYEINHKKKFLGFGWSHNFNSKGSWSEGNHSYLLLKKPKSNKKLNLTLKFKPFKENKSENYNMEIYLNRKLVKKINFYNNYENQKINFNLPDEKNVEDLEIYFRFNGLVSPYDLLMNPDARKLGILLEKILIQEVK